MEWPSKRVPQGGIFHSAKSQLTSDTRQFVKDLIEESKLQISQRQKDYILRTGEPLPPLYSYSGNPYYIKPKLPKVTVRPCTSKRRSQVTIANSDAYRTERFVPRQTPVDREKAKKHLQDVMTYGKDVPIDVPKAKTKLKQVAEEDISEENRYDQLIREIKDRLQWVEKMEQLNSSGDYKTIINQQIQSKLREIEKLKISDDNK